MSESYTPNDEYENFLIGHMEEVAEFVPTKQRRNIEFHGSH